MVEGSFSDRKRTKKLRGWSRFGAAWKSTGRNIEETAWGWGSLARDRRHERGVCAIIYRAWIITNTVRYNVFCTLRARSEIRRLIWQVTLVTAAANFNRLIIQTTARLWFCESVKLLIRMYGKSSRGGDRGWQARCSTFYRGVTSTTWPNYNALGEYNFCAAAKLKS